MKSVILPISLVALLGLWGGAGCVPKKQLTRALYQRDSVQLLLDAQRTAYAQLSTRQDSLQLLKDRLAEETLRLGREKDQLQADYDELKLAQETLNQKYTDLSRTNLDQAARFNKTMAQKTQELQDKEALLKEREDRLHALQKQIADQDARQKELLARIRKALEGFTSDELTAEMRNGNIYVSMSDKLLFKSGSAQLDTKGKQALEKLAQALNTHPELSILVEGHTDPDPIRTERFADNWDLSVIRATAVVRLLSADYKVDAKRLTAAGHAEFFPLVSNDTREGKARNRRTDIVIQPQLQDLFELVRQEPDSGK
ncbi:MAG: OmpA family protein [Bacteroidetes bacterium]|nr:OmpA family protein [Bacteroidota bacterium]